MDNTKKKKGVLDAAMSKFSSSDAPSKEGDQEKRLQSAAHGAGGNLGWNEQAAGMLLDALRDPNNTYAGGTGDTLAKGGADAARRFPASNRTGAELVATPAAVAAGAAAPAGIAANSVIGAAHGAYTVPQDGDRARAAALGAGTGALTGLATDAIAPAVSQMRPPALKPTMTPQTPDASALTARSLVQPPRRSMLPTIPPRAISNEAAMAVRAENQAGRPILPPPSANADGIAAQPIPQARLPMEATGAYRPRPAPVGENGTQYTIRGVENDIAMNEARAAQGLNRASEVVPRGQSLFSAQQAEPTASRSLMPTMPADYAAPASSMRPTSPGSNFGSLRLDEVPTQGPRPVATSPAEFDLNTLKSMEPPPTSTLREYPQDAATLIPGHSVDEAQLVVPKSGGKLPAEVRLGDKYKQGPNDYELPESRNEFLKRAEDNQAAMNKMDDIGQRTVRPAKRKKKAED